MLIEQSIPELVFMMENELFIKTLEKQKLQQEILYYKKYPETYKLMIKNKYYNVPAWDSDVIDLLTKDKNARDLFNIAAREKTDIALLNAIILYDESDLSKKKSLLNSLNKYKKHLRQRIDYLEVSWFFGPTIIIPVCSLTCLGVSEIVYLPKSMLAKSNLKKLGVKMYIIDDIPGDMYCKRYRRVLIAKDS